MTKLTRFDAADYLDSEEVIAEYLNAALEDEDPNVFLTAVGDVAKARGMTTLAKDAGLGRESLYKALAPGAKPRYDTVLKVIRALGIELQTAPSHQQPIPTKRSSRRTNVRR
ncbi:MAG: addiction module antidote protein [Gammaproteobacteria bacterium]